MNYSYHSQTALRKCQILKNKDRVWNCQLKMFSSRGVRLDIYTFPLKQIQSEVNTNSSIHFSQKPLLGCQNPHSTGLSFHHCAIVNTTHISAKDCRKASSISSRVFCVGDLFPQQSFQVVEDQRVVDLHLAGQTAESHASVELLLEVQP